MFVLASRRSSDVPRNVRTIGLIVSDASFHFHSSSANNHPQASSSGGALHQQVLYCLRRQKAHTSAERDARCTASYGVRSGTGLLFIQPGLYLGRAASLDGQPHAILIKVISLQCSNQGPRRRNANARVRESGTSQRGGSQRRGKRWWDASSGGLEEDGSWSSQATVSLGSQQLLGREFRSALVCSGLFHGSTAPAGRKAEDTRLCICCSSVFKHLFRPN